MAPSPVGDIPTFLATSIAAVWATQLDVPEKLSTNVAQKAIEQHTFLTSSIVAFTFIEASFKVEWPLPSIRFTFKLSRVKLAIEIERMSTNYTPPKA